MMRCILTLLCVASALCAEAATHTWTGAAYGDGALADGDTVVGDAVTNNCVLTNNNLRLTGTWSNATWSGNVIAASGVSGLIVSNLVFRATDNGLGLGYSNGFNAFSLSVTNLEIVGCSISNLYYRYASTECGNAPQALVIDAAGKTNISIHNNTLDMLGNGIVIAYSGFSSNVQIYSNTITRVSWGMFLNTLSVGDAYGWRIWANTIDHLDDWDPMGGPCAGSYHNDGIIINGGATAATNHSMVIDRNQIGPHIRTASALLYSQPTDAYSYPGLKVINNVFLLDSNTVSAPFCVMGISNVLYANNTFISIDQTNQSLAFGAMPGSALYNNLTLRVAMAVSHSSGYPAASDYNAWNGPWADGFAFPPFENFTDWKTHSLDSHSTTNAATLNASYAPTLADTVARGTGTNLTALGIKGDFYGNARVTWDIGAVNAESNPPVTPIATNTTIVGPVTMTGGTTKISQP